MANIIHWMNIETIDKRSFTSSSSTDHDRTQISFEFSGKSHFSDWITPQDPRQPRRMVRRINEPLTETFIFVSLDQSSSSSEKARETLNRELEIWPVWASGRQNLIDLALSTARDVIISMPPSHDSIHLHFRVEVLNMRIHMHTLDQNRAIGSAFQRSIQEDGARMVPAVDSSIESLEKKMVMDTGNSCCVCLEDICRGCEGLFMPCLHVFHGDCIKKWLRTSHYCPVCRFEMPTRSN
ncbi:hypothetical protein OROGR_002092 [Orobanche gracilis]